MLLPLLFVYATFLTCNQHTLLCAIRFSGYLCFFVLSRTRYALKRLSACSGSWSRCSHSLVAQGGSFGVRTPL